MSLFRRDPEPADRPQADTVIDQPATPDACRNDYADRHHTTNPHPSSYQAAPHTHGRRH